MIFKLLMFDDLQWNALSLQTSSNIRFVDVFKDKPEVLLIQEKWLKPRVCHKGHEIPLSWLCGVLVVVRFSLFHVYPLTERPPDPEDRVKEPRQEGCRHVRSRETDAVCRWKKPVGQKGKCSFHFTCSIEWVSRSWVFSPCLLFLTQLSTQWRKPPPPASAPLVIRLSVHTLLL